MSQKTMKEHTGTFYVGKNDVGYVRTPDLESSVEIPKHHWNTALHRDTVRFSITSKNRDSYTGRVLSVVERAEHGFAGYLVSRDDSFIVKPLYTKNDLEIRIPSSQTLDAKEGDFVFVEITSWTTFPVGAVTKVFDDPTSSDARMYIFALAKGFDESFPEAVLEEAQAIHTLGVPEEEIAQRRDVRDTITFTIDPDTAKDFDDALSYKKISDDRYEIGIHIADVTYYVHPGSAIDMEAQERATSVYLVDRTIPMLPEVLSNDLCSLRPDTDRLAYSAIFTLDRNGVVHDEWYGHTTIHSDKRFTYTEAQEVLDAGEGEFHEELHFLNTLAKRYQQQRLDSGALMLEKDEPEFILDEDGTPLEIRIKERFDTHKLVEEFMLLANRMVATFISTQSPQHYSIFRVHDTPDRDRVEMLETYLKGLGYDVQIQNGVIPSGELRRILESVDSSIEQDALSLAIAKSMQKAEYSSKNIGHYGLGFEYYTHFTSPIRRYPDVMVHRLLDKALAGVSLTSDEIASYDHLALHSSAREREASEAERDSIKYKQIEYLELHKQEPWNGTITGLVPYGMFVRDTKTYAEGLVTLRSMKDDRYELDTKDNILVGQKTKKVYRIGDRVSVRVTNLDLDMLNVDLELLDE